MDRAIKTSIEATLAAKEAGLYTVFFTLDATREDPDVLLDRIERVATEGHMDSFSLPDSFGGVLVATLCFQGATWILAFIF